MIDRNSSGRATRHELLEFFTSISQKPVDTAKVERVVDKMICETDKGMNGTVTFDELLRWEGSRDMIRWLETITKPFRKQTSNFRESNPVWHPVVSHGGGKSMFATISVHDTTQLCRDTLKDDTDPPIVTQSHLDMLLEKLLYLEARPSLLPTLTLSVTPTLSLTPTLTLTRISKQLQPWSNPTPQRRSL